MPRSSSLPLYEIRKARRARGDAGVWNDHLRAIGLATMRTDTVPRRYLLADLRATNGQVTAALAAAGGRRGRGLLYGGYPLDAGADDWQPS